MNSFYEFPSKQYKLVILLIIVVIISSGSQWLLMASAMLYIVLLSTLPLLNLLRRYFLEIRVKCCFQSTFWSCERYNNQLNANCGCISNIQSYHVFPLSLSIKISLCLELFRKFLLKFHKIKVFYPSFWCLGVPWRQFRGHTKICIKF